MIMHHITSETADSIRFSMPLIKRVLSDSLRMDTNRKINENKTSERKKCGKQILGVAVNSYRRHRTNVDSILSVNCCDRLYWTDRSRNTVESISLQSMQHRVEDIHLSPTKLVSDIASYKASDSGLFAVCLLCVFNATDSPVVMSAKCCALLELD